MKTSYTTERDATLEQRSLRATQVQIDSFQSPMLAEELMADAPDDEVRLDAKQRYVRRLSYQPVTSRERRVARARRVANGHDGFRLVVGQYGALDQLRLTTCPIREPGPEDVQIQVLAAGLNFRDVLTTMGMLSTHDESRSRIGFECSGVVRAVGGAVHTVRPGDTVLAVSLRCGTFGSFITVPATSVRLIPGGMDPVSMAGVPLVFATAWYALAHLARLAAGEKVLVHSGTGGTGLAAIAVVRLLGAEVLATAGTAEKRGYLRGMGVQHVMDSRSLDFADQVLAATDDVGVDVVLNSLAGPAIRAGLQTLRPFGRFVELGVRDIMADSALGMAVLQHNITLSTVNLIELQQERPDLFARVLDEVLERFESGQLGPLPHQAFNLGAAAEAFRSMAGAHHVGKLVLNVPQYGESEATVADPSPVRPGGSYIVTGGLRGVGLETARWLAQQGATRLILNGRSEPSLETRDLLDRLRSDGVEIDVELGDIADADVAQRLVATATDGGRRLNGVVHAAMVLDDAVITNITQQKLESVWRPKVMGAWQLHEALSDHAPDWFVLYSSMASLIGNVGQGAYAAANSWLDGFARWRSATGHPTLAVAWGPWGQTGQATNFAERGYQTIRNEDGLRALAELLVHRRVRTGVIPGAPEGWIPGSGGRAPFFAELLADATPETTTDIRSELMSRAPGLSRRLFLESHISDHVRKVLRLSTSTIDPQTPLRSLGFDSLLSVELRTRLETSLSLNLENTFMWKHQTLADLATSILQHFEPADAR